MKKTFTILIAAIAAILMMAQPVMAETITVGQNPTNSTSTSYLTSEQAFTITVELAMNNYIPSNGQMRGNQNGISSNFYLRNTAAINGTISSITINGITYGSNSSSVDVDKIWLTTGSSVISVPSSGTGSHPTKNTNDNTPTTLTWSNLSGSCFCIHLTKGGTSGTVKMTSITITYTPSGGGSTVATPTFSPAAGAVVSGTTVTISCATEGATIYYTIDGTDPNTSSSVYSTPITLTTATTIKAYAVKDGYIDSDIATAEYTIATPVATPTFSLAAGTYTTNQDVTISCATDGATIYYTTNGSDPTTSSTEYSSAINVSTNTTIKAFAVKDGMINSEIATASYTFAATLPFSFEGGKADIANTKGLTQNGLGSDYGSSPKLRFDDAGDYIILNIDEAPGTLTFDIKGNSLTGTYKFSVMQSANGADYFALKEYTSIGSSTSSETLTPASTTRYIKWVYTTKDNGNVALGNINLKAPEPTITVSPESVGVLASGVIDATLSLTYERLEISEADDFDILFCDENGDELTPAPDWITAEVIDGTSDDYVVSYTVEENDDEERTAYFKVFALGNEDYVYSNLVTVTQAAYVAPENKYIRFSGELVEGDYLIVYNGGAMNNNTVTSDRLQYEEVTAINNVIATDDATIIWHIAKSGNYWTIYSADKEKYAASTGVKNKAQLLADGTDDKALWTISGTDTYEFVNKQNTTNGVNANLRKNGSYGFACYSTDTGGALSLYIKNCVLPVTNDELTESAEIPEGNITVYDDLTIPSGDNIVLTVSGTLEVQGTLSNTVPSHLIVKEGGQLIIPAAKADPVKATFQRDITAYEQVTGKDNYYLIANPTTDVDGINPTTVTGMLTNDYDLYYFDESKNGVEWRNYKKETFNLVNGTGYLYANSVTKTLEFAGTVPTGTSANITLSKTDDNTYAGFNLVGNPMSVNITSMNIGGSACSYYKLDSETGVFAVSTDPIIVGEAFMVEAPTNEATLSLNPGAKGENGFNNDVIRLEVSNSKYTDVAFLYFGNHLPLTKINHLNDEAPMLYIHNEKVDQAVAVMNDRSEVKSVNVNFEAKVMGSYTISGKAEKGNFSYMHLYDRLTGADTDLLISDYTFIGSTTDATDRFILRFEAIDNNSESESFAYQNGSDIIINGAGELQIFDVMGRMVSTQQINGVERVNVKSQGVYIFRLNEKTQKIVVR